VVLLLCAGCGSTSAPTHGPPDEVQVSGTFVGSGGPSPGVTVPLSGGVIHLVPTSGSTVDAVVGADGHFDTTVRPGHYTATGQAGVSECTVPQTFDATDEPVELSLACAIP
jgi:hypothetical protein